MGEKDSITGCVLPSQTKSGMWQLVRSCCAEIFGTCLLVFAATMGGVCATPCRSPLVAASLSVGLSTFVAVWVTGPISGGQINPAVSFALMLSRRLSFVHFLFFSTSQVIGGVIGCLLAKLFNPEIGLDSESGITTPGDGMAVIDAFALEIWTTFVLVFGVLQAIDDTRPDAWNVNINAMPLAFLVCSVHVFHVIMAGPLTGNSMNPARSLGPAIVNWYWLHQWVYIFAPLLGSLLATMLHEFCFCHGACWKRTIAFLTERYFDRTIDFTD